MDHEDHHRHRTGGARIAIAAAATAMSLGVVTVPTVAAHADRYSAVVHPGESIQVAIDAARPGDPRLAGPKDDAPGPASEAGICVHGAGVQLAPFVGEHRRFVSVERRVRDVTITGFRVEGFTGPNVAFVGASGARLDRNVLADGDQYGALTVGSTRTRFSRNTVTSSAAVRNIGMCADDVAPAIVDHNDVSGYVAGLCVQTQAADFRSNVVHDNCIGVYVDPGIGALVRDNRITSNNAACQDFDFITGIDVYLDGAHGTQVTGNRIEGHTPPAYGAGIVITDNPSAGPAIDNTVRGNRFVDNTLDLLVDTTGTGNIVTRNRCTTSQPAGLCR